MHLFDLSLGQMLLKNGGKIATCSHLLYCLRTEIHVIHGYITHHSAFFFSLRQHICIVYLNHDTDKFFPFLD